MDDGPPIPERAEESVVLLSPEGTAIGTASKHTVHTESTPLHLAFSCHVLDPRGRVLVTRRALHKRTWPGVWTNSVCGHPGPGESFEDAIIRRAAFELGLTVEGVEMALPNFRYRATDASGVVENEMCPVYLAHTRAEPTPNPAEVMDHAWVEPADLARAVASAPWALSPWLVEHAAELPLLLTGDE